MGSSSAGGGGLSGGPQGGQRPLGFALSQKWHFQLETVSKSHSEAQAALPGAGAAARVRAHRGESHEGPGAEGFCQRQLNASSLHDFTNQPLPFGAGCS